MTDNSLFIFQKKKKNSGMSRAGMCKAICFLKKSRTWYATNLIDYTKWTWTTNDKLTVADNALFRFLTVIINSRSIFTYETNKSYIEVELPEITSAPPSESHWKQQLCRSGMHSLSATNSWCNRHGNHVDISAFPAYHSLCTPPVIQMQNIRKLAISWLFIRTIAIGY